MQLSEYTRSVVLALTLIGAAPSTSAAQVSNARMVSGWFVANVKGEPATRDSCVANTTFADGTKLELTIYTSGAVGGLISFENGDWDSLNSAPLGGGGRPDPTMPLTLAFDGSASAPLSTDFGVHPRLVLRGAVLRDKPNLSKYFEPDPFGSLIASIAQASSLTVTSGEKTIGRWPMAGSKTAMLALSECARTDTGEKQSRLQNDPFRR